MNRSNYKSNFIDLCLIKKIQSNNIPNNLKIYSRRSTIHQSFVNKIVHIYNGIKFIPILIKKEMVNHKFGEFSFTRRPNIFKNKNKNKK